MEQNRETFLDLKRMDLLLNGKYVSLMRYHTKNFESISIWSVIIRWRTEGNFATLKTYSISYWVHFLIIPLEN
jgi:hypothetical protein